MFDGLSRLVSLNLSHNVISSVGLHVFTNVSGLVSLWQIDLSFNQLTQLEPWPFIRGQMAPRSASGKRLGIPASFITLQHNNISEFTDNLNWTFHCGDKPLSLSLDLMANGMRHMTDWAYGWNIGIISNC